MKFNMLNYAEIMPAFKDNYTTVGMSSSDEYLPYLTVCLQSIVDNSCNFNNYDIVIFTSSNDDIKKKIIKNHFSKKNVSIRFYNPQHFFKDIKLRVTHDYFNEVCFYRIVAPFVFKNYKKVIFTDIDLVFKSDIKNLDSVDIGNSPLAACKEPLWESFIKKNINLKTINIVDYSKNVLKLKDINNYYNTGVVVFNIEEFNNNNYVEQLLNLINTTNFFYQEQCALNCLLNDKIYNLDSIWNGEVIENAVDNYSLFEKANVIHFLTKNKPWNSYKNPLNFIWWEYARKTPFYEQILYNMTNNLIQTKLKNIKNKKKYSFNYKKCSILKNITVGNAKKHYTNKAERFKELLSKIED